MTLPTHWTLKSSTDQCELAKERCRKSLRRIQRAKREPTVREATFLGEAVGHLRLCAYDEAWEAAEEADRRGKELPVPPDLHAEDIEELSVDRLKEMINEVRCLGPLIRDNSLNLRTDGNLSTESDGFHLQAADGSRSILFILPAEVAEQAFAIDIHSGELLETQLRDRLPEIWEACRRAYNFVSVLEDKDNLRITLASTHFSVD